MNRRAPLRKVLLVDDEPDVRLVARMALATVGGLEVLECGGGAEAVPAAARWRPDLVLLDVMMPGLDGPATLAALRDALPGQVPPVVFMTARVQRAEVEEYRALGAAGVIGKPFEPMGLAAKLRELWDGLAPPSPPPLVAPEAIDAAVQRALARFTASFPEVANQLEAAVRAGQDQVVRAIAHRLRGTGGTLGLAELAAAATEVEAALRDGRPLQVLGDPLLRLFEQLSRPPVPGG